MLIQTPSSQVELKVEEVLLHEAAGGLRGLVIVDQRSILFSFRRVLVEVLAGLLYEKVCGILGDGDRIRGVVDALIGHTVTGLAPPTIDRCKKEIEMSCEMNDIILNMNTYSKSFFSGCHWLP